MERREYHDQQQPLGICRRFFDFVMKNLVGQSLKRIGYAPLVSAMPKEVEFGPVENIDKAKSHVSARDEVLDSSGWIPVEVAREHKASLKTIVVKDDDGDDGYERVEEEVSTAGKSVAIQEVRQHLHVDEHFEEFIKRTKKKIRKPAFHVASESDARDGSSK
ncbi:hypothetical protein ACLOJK_018648 [Asimina triloba]